MAVASPDIITGTATPIDARTGTEPGGKWDFLGKAKAFGTAAVGALDSAIAATTPDRARAIVVHSEAKPGAAAVFAAPKMESRGSPDLPAISRLGSNIGPIPEPTVTAEGAAAMMPEVGSIAAEANAKNAIADRLDRVLEQTFLDPAKLSDTKYVKDLIDKGQITPFELDEIKRLNLNNPDSYRDAAERRKKLSALSVQLYTRQQQPAGKTEEQNRLTIVENVETKDAQDQIAERLKKVITDRKIDFKNDAQLRDLIDKGVLTASEVRAIRRLGLDRSSLVGIGRDQKITDLAKETLANQQSERGKTEEEARVQKADAEAQRIAALPPEVGVVGKVREQAEAVLQTVAERLPGDSEQSLRVLKKSLPILFGVAVAGLGAYGAHRMGYTKMGAEAAARAFQLGRELPIKEALAALRKARKTGTEAVAAVVPTEVSEAVTEGVAEVSEAVAETSKKAIDKLMDALKDPEERRRVLSTIGSSAVLEGLGISQGWNFLKSMVSNAAEEATG